jgi:DNA-binding PadR family transcriptional regulator
VVADAPLSLVGHHPQLQEDTVRRPVEAIFEIKNGGHQTLHQWLMQQRKAGKSFRSISQDLEHLTGVRVSHQTIVNWIVEG